MQLTPLREFVERMGWTLTGEYLEKQSSMKKRPVFNKLLDDARRRKFDQILVWKIDRFARSMKQFIDVTCELGSRGVSVRSLTQNICSDVSDPMGKFILGLFALLAELERNIIVERVNAGLREARRKGVRFGRPRARVKTGEAVMLRQQGMTWRAISVEMGIPVMTLRSALGLDGDRRKRADARFSTDVADECTAIPPGSVPQFR